MSELHALALFEGCEDDDLARVAGAVTGVRHVVEGEVICAEGEKADRWWIVVDGMADVTVAGLYTATIGPGESIGELALLDGAPRGATVTAATDMVLHEVDGDAVRRRAARPARGWPWRCYARWPIAAAAHEPTTDRGRGSRRGRPRRRRRPGRRGRQPSQLDPLAPRLLRGPHGAAGGAAGAGPGALVGGRPVLGRHPLRGRPPPVSTTSALLGSVTTLDPPDMPASPAGSEDDDPTRRRRPPAAAAARVEGVHAQGHQPVGRALESIVAGLLEAAAQTRTELRRHGRLRTVVPAQIISEMLGMPTEDMRAAAGVVLRARPGGSTRSARPRSSQRRTRRRGDERLRPSGDRRQAATRRR